jgi:triphosphoribosyl-dephospho-CoA synthase
MARAGQQPTHRRGAARALARSDAAQSAMLRATGGINTHRGAIWALACWPVLRAGSAARAARPVARMAGVIARMPDRHRPAHTGNKGEWVRATYGVGGARTGRGRVSARHRRRPAHAARVRARGDAEPTAQVNALLAIMAQLDDTCVLARRTGGTGRRAGRRRSGARRRRHRHAERAPPPARSRATMLRTGIARRRSRSAGRHLFLDRLCAVGEP